MKRHARFLELLLRRAPHDEIAAEYALVMRQRAIQIVPVSEPLLLVTQIGRSGGTLLARLFDGHPECHVVPHELGRMVRGLQGVEEGRDPWEALTPLQQEDRFERGFRQSGKRLHGDRSRQPFLLPPIFQRVLFERTVAKNGAQTTREIADAYMTAYFNSWLDNRNLRTGPKRWVVGFEPGLPPRKAFDRVYPDGRAVSLVRDPWSWYASARRFNPKRYDDRNGAVAQWMKATETSIAWRAGEPGRVALLSFRDLVSAPEETMRSVSAWLGIDFVPSMLEPTFNGLPIGPNSSYAPADAPVSTEPLERGRRELSAEDAAYVDEHAAALYERALEATLAVGVSA
ncbi:MAG: sulfotransferase [Verrucomicrobiota bacterium]